MFVLKTRGFCVELWRHKGLLERAGGGEMGNIGGEGVWHAALESEKKKKPLLLWAYGRPENSPFPAFQRWAWGGEGLGHGRVGASLPPGDGQKGL